MSIIESTADAASAASINVLIVIDTEYVKTNYPNPSKDQNNPTRINNSSQFMICSAPRGVVRGQGTGYLNFRANLGDFVSFYGSSIYDNSDDAVIVYGIKYRSGDSVFNQFAPNLVTRAHAVMPDTTTSNGLPAMTASMNFTSLDSRVQRNGTENLYVYFALYTRAADGETQQLFGYYCWDPTVVVN